MSWFDVMMTLPIMLGTLYSRRFFSSQRNSSGGEADALSVDRQRVAVDELSAKVGETTADTKAVKRSAVIRRNRRRATSFRR